MSTSPVGVIGSGTMGGSIAHQVAMSGYDVKLLDVSQPALSKAVERIKTWTEASVARGKTSEQDAKNILSRISATTDFGQLKDCKFTIEAVFEDLKIKEDVFSQIDDPSFR